MGGGFVFWEAVVGPLRRRDSVDRGGGVRRWAAAVGLKFVDEKIRIEII